MGIQQRPAVCSAADAHLPACQREGAGREGLIRHACTPARTCQAVPACQAWHAAHLAAASLEPTHLQGVTMFWH